MGHRTKYQEKLPIKMITCRNCGKVQVEADESIVFVVCHMCCASYGPKIKEIEEKVDTGFPRGWKFYTQFVHIDGKVFEKGIENVGLKGTLPPTEIKVMSKFESKKRRELKEKKSSDKHKR